MIRLNKLQVLRLAAQLYLMSRKGVDGLTLFSGSDGTVAIFERLNDTRSDKVAEITPKGVLSTWTASK